MAEKDPQLPLNQILIFNFYWPAQSETMPVVTESGVIMCWERRRKKESVHDEDRSAVTMLPFNGGGTSAGGGVGSRSSVLPTQPDCLTRGGRDTPESSERPTSTIIHTRLTLL